MLRLSIVIVSTLMLPALHAQTAPPTQAPSTSQYAAMRDAERDDPKLKLADYAGLRYYAEDDLALGPPKPGDPPRVVFFGDSITHNWGNKTYSDLFQRKKNYINRGIGGQTTAQMLLRYRQDVLSLQPKVVVLLGGINDLSSAKVPDVVVYIEQNIASIVELAQLHGERIILCSITPVSDTIKPITPTHDPAKILAVNTWLKAYAAAKHIPSVDYYDAVTDGHDRIQTELTADGLHPNKAGVARMEPLVEAAIAEELKR